MGHPVGEGRGGASSQVREGARHPTRCGRGRGIQSGVGGGGASSQVRKRQGLW